MARSCVAMLLLPLVLAGCALPQDYETHVIRVAEGDAVRAQRFAGRAGNPVEDLWIDPRRAPPFQFRFPDGAWVDSRSIDANTLAAHGIPVTHYSTFSSATWHPPISLPAAVAGRHQFFTFSVQPDGSVSALKLGACGLAFEQVLRTADGASFGFPLPVADIERIFGPVTRVERLPIVTGFTCF